jgi:hypothetical protein
MKKTKTFYGKMVGTHCPKVAIINWEIDGYGELHMTGDCGGSSGQCLDEIRDNLHKIDGTIEWDLCHEMLEVWERWHLNHMRAGCEHQRAAGWTIARLSERCPVCEYQYGHAWLKESIPESIVNQINNWKGDE